MKPSLDYYSRGDAMGASRRNVSGSHSGGVDSEKLLDNIAEQTRSTRNLFIIYISYLLYFGLSIFSIQDIELLQKSTVTLPFFQVPVATDAFFYLAPTLAIVIFVYFHMHLQNLRTMIRQLRSSCSEQLVYIFPWTVTLPEKEDPALTSKLQQYFVRIALWWLLPASLALCSYWTMKKHDTLDTAVVINIFIVGVACTLYFRFGAGQSANTKGSHDSKGKLSRRQKVGRGIAALTLWSGILFGLIIPAVNSGGIIALDLYSANLSRKPDIADDTRRWAILDGVNLNGADLRYSFLRRANLVSAELQNVDASFADFAGSDFRNARLKQAIFFGANLFDTDLFGVELDNADLRHANLDSAYLVGASLRHSDFAASLYAKIRKSASIRNDRQGATLRHANLFKSDLRHASFMSAVLIAAKLSYARLDSANLRFADLDSANLSRAVLRGADLSYANLRGARLDGADLAEADLEDARNLSVEQLLSARTLYNAELGDSLSAVFESDSVLSFQQRYRFRDKRSEKSLFLDTARIRELIESWKHY